MRVAKFINPKAKAKANQQQKNKPTRLVGVINQFETLVVLFKTLPTVWMISIFVI